MTGASAAARACRWAGGSGSYPRDHRAERRRAPARRDELRRGPDDLQRAGLALLAGRSPRGDPVPAEDDPDGLRVGRGDGRDIQAELEAGPPPRYPRHPVAEALGGQLLPVRRGGQRDPGVRMQMVHVRRVHQPVHRGVDRRRGSPLAKQAEVERRHHLVLPVHAGIHVRQRAQPVQPQHRQPGRPQRAQVTARALDPQQFGVFAGHRVDRGALGRGVAPGVVRVPRIGAQPVRPRDQLLDSAHAPHPAWWPPARSATIFSA